MNYHSTIDSTFLGFATSVRRWLRTPHCEWHTEVSLSRTGYFSIGLDIFCDEHVFLIHARLFGLWVSLSFNSNWVWMCALRERFYASFGKYRGREFRLGYSDAAITWHFFAKEDESSTRDPWWMHRYIYMPWHPEWIATEIVSVDGWKVAHREDINMRRLISRLYRLGFTREADAANHANAERKKVAKEAHSMTAEYVYVLQSGERQVAQATFYVERMYHGFRWLKLPLRSRTSIWVEFDRELGERTGSWKGGVLGTGTELENDETPLDALRRMERTRKFK